jgi:hypoxanthine phosphoribosyltransferase
VLEEQVKLYIDKKKIDRRVSELAERISRDYKGKVPIFVGVLNGAFVFLSDLIRKLDLDVEIDFLKLSSYGDTKISSGDVRLLKDLNCELAGRDIIVVEDTIDSGLSIKFIHDLIANHKPNSLEFAALLIKSVPTI